MFNPPPSSPQLKPPRLLSLLAESNPAENELQSEAQFQRLLAAYNGLPIRRPKSSRTASDRGRYPEEALVDNDDDRESSPSEDEEEYSTTAVGSMTSVSVPIVQTPGATFDEMSMSEMFRNSPSGSVNGMDVDMVRVVSLYAVLSCLMSQRSSLPLRRVTRQLFPGSSPHRLYPGDTLRRLPLASHDQTNGNVSTLFFLSHASLISDTAFLLDRR